MHAGNLFGSQPQSTPSMFGSSSPGFGAGGNFGFGGTPAQSSPSPFGAPPAASSPFGASPSTFGTNLFGGQQVRHRLSVCGISRPAGAPRGEGGRVPPGRSQPLILAKAPVSFGTQPVWRATGVNDSLKHHINHACFLSFSWGMWRVSVQRDSIINCGLPKVRIQRQAELDRLHWRHEGCLHERLPSARAVASSCIVQCTSHVAQLLRAALSWPSASSGQITSPRAKVHNLDSMRFALVAQFCFICWLFMLPSLSHLSGMKPHTDIFQKAARHQLPSRPVPSRLHHDCRCT